jgi:adenylate cyclase
MDIERWIIDQGLNGSSISTLLTGVAERLVVGGVPLLRAYLALPTVNPTVRAMNYSWIRGAGAVVEGISHERSVAAFEQSPFGHMLREQIPTKYWHLADKDARFPIFGELRALGAADYLAYLISFETKGALAMQGVALSFSTDRQTGFSPEEIASIGAMVPLLALAAYRMTLLDITVSMLDTYVGLSAGRRVLGGEVRRGTGQTLTAALLVADLRGFTSLADHGSADLVARLDEHLEAMADAVTARGGEVLKFLGDGLLAAFPFDDEHGEAKACEAAVNAAVEASARNRAVNAAYPQGAQLELDVALHSGEVFYGNVGAAGRLDFTVIGPTVNEVCRMEALCGPLDYPLILSGSVARACRRPTRSIGHHRLHGFSQERELFTLA